MVAIFNLGGGEIALILALILMLFGPRLVIPPMAEGLKDGIEQFGRFRRQSDRESRFDKDFLVDGITILLLIVLSFVVLACLRS